ncbi:MAG: T9SS type A sorting domain-containing protein [bacterium]|nr:T9SS type A sorting domain-containing protein [bacterium]
MSRSFPFARWGLLLLLLLAVPAAAHEDLPQFARIDEALKAGRIDADQALFHRFQYVFDWDKLPSDLVPVERTPIRCATPLIIEYNRVRDQLRPETVAAIESWLAPPAGDKLTYISPAGLFQLTFVTSGGNGVPPADVSPANGVPDFIEKVASYLDTAWDTEITQWGFTGPLHSPYYSIGFANQSGAYGYTTVSGSTTRIVLENDYVGFPPNDDPEGDALGAAKVTCAHEFKHASQYRTSLWSEGGWVEVDGTWAEDLVFDATNDYYTYLGSGNGITSPGTSLDGGGTGSYEDCIWQQWMSETWTPQVIVDLWAWRATHQSQSMLASYDAVLTARGSSIATGYPIFAAWNYACGTRAITGIGYQEAASYPTSQATTVAALPYSTSGALSHLAAANFHCTGFTPGEPGELRVDFDGADGQAMALMAVIRRNDGTGLIESIALDGSNTASTTLSVPLADLNRVGIVVVNAGITGDNRAYTLTVSRELPPPAATLSSAGIAKTMTANATGSEVLDLSNTGAVGSQLQWAAYVVENNVGLPAKAGHRGAAAAPLASGRTAPGKLEQAAPLASVKYAGDCVFGSNDTGNIQGYYSTWVTGQESYATFVNPADYACACNPGFNVRAVHMLLYVPVGATIQAQVSLATAGAACDGPGAILETSTPVSFSGFATAGYYDLEVPCDFACQDMDGSYFLVFEILNAVTGVGIPIDTTPGNCVNFNEWGEGWQDVVVGYGFAGDFLLWGDVDCCGTPEPSSSVLSPNGGEVFAVGSSLQVDWTAQVLTEVKVELSRDGGGSWEVLAASTPNDGTETFVLTGPDSYDCVVRVGSTDGTVTDTSNGSFWVYQPVPWLTAAPLDGTLAQGATQPLTLSFDTTGMADGAYQAWLVILDNAASSPEIVPVGLTVQTYISGTGVPTVFALRGNAPNPFNPSTRISFSVAKAGQAVVDVLDLQGRHVRTLLSGLVEAGERSLEWDGRDEAGRPVASGAYLARLRADGQVATHKMVLTK